MIIPSASLKEKHRFADLNVIWHHMLLCSCFEWTAISHSWTTVFVKSITLDNLKFTLQHECELPSLHIGTEVRIHFLATNRMAAFPQQIILGFSSHQGNHILTESACFSSGTELSKGCIDTYIVGVAWKKPGKSLLKIGVHYLHLSALFFGHISDLSKTEKCLEQKKPIKL